MAHLNTPTPPAHHLGWDIQFSRIAGYVAPRVMRVLANLAEEGLQRGLKVKLSRKLYDDRDSSSLLVFTDEGQIIAMVVFVLNDGWVIKGKPGAMLELELREGEDLRRVRTSLKRFSAEYATDPAEVYYNAGDEADADNIRAALVKLL
jgi:hypothetical protein